MKDKERDIFDDLFRSKLQDFEDIPVAVHACQTIIATQDS